MQSKVHVSRSNRAFLSPTRENGSGSRTEKGAFQAGKGYSLLMVPSGAWDTGTGVLRRWQASHYDAV